MTLRERELSHDAYVPLHVHTFYSLLGRIPATSSPELIVKTAKQKGFGAVAITDTENFYGLAKFFAACQKFDVKPIPGVELPVDLGFGKRPGHFTFLASDNEGLMTLFSWVSKVCRDKQILNPQDLTNKSGVVILIRGENLEFQEFLKQENVFYAIDSPSKKSLTAAAFVEGQTGKTVIANEVRMAQVLEVNILKFLFQIYKNGNHQIDSGLLNHSLKKPIEIWVNYKNFPGAIARSAEIAQSVKVQPPEAPKIKAKIVPEGGSSQAYLESLVLKAAEKIGEAQNLSSRILNELSVIRQFGFADYILICYEIGQFCRQRGIEFLVTGSSNNSLVLNLLGLTRVDAKNLMFERFLNPNRLDFPDVDFDFPYDRRGEVVEFILNRYDEATLLSVVKRLRKDSLLKLAQSHNIDLAPAQLQQLEGANLPYEVATHSSGVTFFEQGPQQKIESAPANIVAQVDKDDVEKIYHLPKIDLLSNIGIARLAKTKLLLEQDNIKIEKFWENDPKTIKRIFNGKTLGISGVESPHLTNILKTIGQVAKHPNFEHLVQALALARPAAAARQIYYATLAGKEHPFSQYPEIAKIIEPTGFSIIFQEQVMQIAQQVAGLSLEVGEALRKMMAEGVTKQERKRLLALVDARLEKGYPKDVRRELIRQFTNFASYGFLEGHARALATLSYELAWLAEHYPTHFWAAVLTTVADKPEDVLYPPQAYINQALRDGIKFTFPTIDKLPPNPAIEEGRVVIGAKLIGERVNLPNIYSQFLRLLYSGRTTPKILANYQMENFGSVFTANPVILFPESVHFKPEKDRQTIVAQKLLTRVWRDLIFVTLDSGILLNVILPKPLAQRKRQYLQNPFWRLNIRRGDSNWEVFDIFPLGGNS